MTALPEICQLYRPVGLREMVLILEADSRAFPPRLPEQPFFYPVLTPEYAHQIARDWNTRDARSGFAGFVTEFVVDATYAASFEKHTVGASVHSELWIPADDLDQFNQHIQGHIEINAAYYGAGYKGLKHRLQDIYADEMFVMLYKTAQSSGQDFFGELTLNRNAILLNFNYWLERDFSHDMTDEQKTQFLKLLAHVNYKCEATRVAMNSGVMRLRLI